MLVKQFWDQPKPIVIYAGGAGGGAQSSADMAEFAWALARETGQLVVIMRASLLLGTDGGFRAGTAYFTEDGELIVVADGDDGVEGYQPDGTMRAQPGVEVAEALQGLGITVRPRADVPPPELAILFNHDVRIPLQRPMADPRPEENQDLLPETVSLLRALHNRHLKEFARDEEMEALRGQALARAWLLRIRSAGFLAQTAAQVDQGVVEYLANQDRAVQQMLDRADTRVAEAKKASNTPSATAGPPAPTVSAFGHTGPTHQGGSDPTWQGVVAQMPHHSSSSSGGQRYNVTFGSGSGRRGVTDPAGVTSDPIEQAILGVWIAGGIRHHFADEAQMAAVLRDARAWHGWEGSWAPEEYFNEDTLSFGTESVGRMETLYFPSGDGGYRIRQQHRAGPGVIWHDHVTHYFFTSRYAADTFRNRAGFARDQRRSLTEGDLLGIRFSHTPRQGDIHIAVVYDEDRILESVHQSDGRVFLPDRARFDTPTLVRIYHRTVGLPDEGIGAVTALPGAVAQAPGSSGESASRIERGLSHPDIESDGDHDAPPPSDSASDSDSESEEDFDDPAPSATRPAPPGVPAIPAALRAAFGEHLPSHPAEYEPLLRSLEVLEAARAGDRRFGSGPIDLEGIARKVLRLDSSTVVTPETHLELMSVTGRAHWWGRAGSLAAVSAYRLQSQGALAQSNELADENGAFTGRNFTESANPSLYTGGPAVQDSSGDLANAPAASVSWWTDPYLVLALRSGLPLVPGEHGHLVEVDEDELAELIAHDPKRRSGAQVVILAPDTRVDKDAFPRRIAQRIGARVWSPDGAFQLIPMSDGTPRLRVTLLNPAPGKVPATRWVPSDPGLVADEPPVTVAALDGGIHAESDVQSYTALTSDGRRLFGRIYMDEPDTAAFENALRHISEMTHYTDYYEGTPGVDRNRESGLLPLPRPFANSYFSMGHARLHFPTLPMGTTGANHAVSDPELVKVLKRSKSMQSLPPTWPVWFIWCELAAPLPGTDRLVVIRVPQMLANETGRDVYAVDAQVGIIGQTGNLPPRAFKWDEPDRPEFRWMKLRPEPGAAVLSSWADQVGMPAGMVDRETRVLRWVRAARRIISADIDTDPALAWQFQVLLRGFSALERQRLTEPGNVDTGPLTWRELERIVLAHARQQGWEQALTANMLAWVLAQTEAGNLQFPSAPGTIAAPHPSADAQDPDVSMRGGVLSAADVAELGISQDSDSESDVASSMVAGDNGESSTAAVGRGLDLSTLGDGRPSLTDVSSDESSEVEDDDESSEDEQLPPGDKGKGKETEAPSAASPAYGPSSEIAPLAGHDQAEAQARHLGEVPGQEGTGAHDARESLADIAPSAQDLLLVQRQLASEDPLIIERTMNGLVKRVGGELAAAIRVDRQYVLDAGGQVALHVPNQAFAVAGAALVHEVAAVLHVRSAQLVFDDVQTSLEICAPSGAS